MLNLSNRSIAVGSPARATGSPGIILAAGTAAALALAAGAAAQPCQPRWDAFPAGPSGTVDALLSFTDAAGPALYVGGYFEQVGGVPMPRIARYDGTNWQGLNAGIPGNFNSHGIFGCCAAVFDLHGETIGGVPTLFVGGDFITVDGVVVESIARWNGSAFSAMAGGMAHEPTCFDCPPRIYSLLKHSDGSLYAGGAFALAGGTTVNHVARWTGSQWAALGSGLAPDPQGFLPAWATSLATFDDGTGPALYVGGAFAMAGGNHAHNIARWNGTAWSPVGGGFTQPAGGPTPNVNALAVFDDGTGPALYAAGYFLQAGDPPVPARHIARWNGQAWSGLGPGLGDNPNDQALALAVFDDGSGPALYVGGEFAVVGTQPAGNLARWSGGQLTPVPGGGTNGRVHALEVDQGSLYVGGTFTTAGGMPSLNLARRVGCGPTPCYANCDGSTQEPVLNVQDFSCFLTRYAAGETYANCDGSTQPPILNVQDFSCFLTKYAEGCR